MQPCVITTTNCRPHKGKSEGIGIAVRTLTQKDFQFVKYYQEVEVKRVQTVLGTSAFVLERKREREREVNEGFKCR